MKVNIEIEKADLQKLLVIVTNGDPLGLIIGKEIVMMLRERLMQREGEKNET